MIKKTRKIIRKDTKEDAEKRLFKTLKNMGLV